MVYITPFNFEEEILKSELCCMVKFSSETCSLCEGLEVVYENLYKDYASQIKFATVDVDEYEFLGELFEIDGVPTIYFFTDECAEEIPYPEDPSTFSGYREQDLVHYLNNRLEQKKI